MSPQVKIVALEDEMECPAVFAQGPSLVLSTRPVNKKTIFTSEPIKLSGKITVSF